MGEDNSYHLVVYRAGAKLAYSRYAALLSSILVLAYAAEKRPTQILMQEARFPRPVQKPVRFPSRNSWESKVLVFPG
jgi:hypothetical protein